MTRDETPMWEDPQESSALRQLLRAGHVEHSDYDVERGLARHLAQLQAGTPLPAWAVQTSLQKSAAWTWTLLPWLLPPMISAGVVGAWLALRPVEPAVPPVQATPALATAAVQSPGAAPVPGRGAPQHEALAAKSSQPDPARGAGAGIRVAAREHVDDQAQVVSRDARDASEARDRREHRNALAMRSARSSGRAPNLHRGRADGRDARSARTQANGNASRDGLGRHGSGDGSADGSDESTVIATAAAAATASKVEPVVEDTAAAQPPPREPQIDQIEKADKADKADDDRTPESDEVSGARLEREMRMLAVAQRVLTDDPGRSLRLCRQGENEFPGSMFSAERKQVALLALVQLGRVNQARREGIPFLRAYPNAPWSARLREALASGHVPAP